MHIEATSAKEQNFVSFPPKQPKHFGFSGHRNETEMELRKSRDLYETNLFPCVSSETRVSSETIEWVETNSENHVKFGEIKDSLSNCVGYEIHQRKLGKFGKLRFGYRVDLLDCLRSED